MKEPQREKASFEVESEKENANSGSVKLGIATMKNLTRLLRSSAKENRKEGKCCKNIHFCGASWLDDSSSTFCISCDA